MFVDNLYIPDDKVYKETKNSKSMRFPHYPEPEKRSIGEFMTSLRTFSPQVCVLDTSILNYQAYDVECLFRHFSFTTTPEVISEAKCWRYRSLLQKLEVTVPEPLDRIKAAVVLNDAQKAKTRRQVLPYLDAITDGRITADDWKEDPQYNADRALVDRIMHKISPKRSWQDQAHDARQYINHHWVTSPADVSVLATAIGYARDAITVVCANDRDLHDGVHTARARLPGMREKMFFASNIVHRNGNTEIPYVF